MSVPPQRSPPTIDRDDGLTAVRCPYCVTIWFRSQAPDIDHLLEIRCQRCRRFVIFRVRDFMARDIAAIELPREDKAPSERSPHSSNGDFGNGKVCGP